MSELNCYVNCLHSIWRGKYDGDDHDDEHDDNDDTVDVFYLMYITSPKDLIFLIEHDLLLLFSDDVDYISFLLKHNFGSLISQSVVPVVVMVVVVVVVVVLAISISSSVLAIVL